MAYADVQFGMHPNGAKSSLMDPNGDPYPEDTPTPPARKGITVRFTEEEAADISLIGALWTAYDKAAKRKNRKWKQAAVVRHAVRMLIDQVRGNHEEEWPKSKAEQLEFVRRQVAKRKQRK